MFIAGYLQSNFPTGNTAPRPMLCHAFKGSFHIKDNLWQINTEEEYHEAKTD